MVSVSQSNHSYKAKEPTGLYKFQRAVIFWFEFNPRYLERDQGRQRPQLLFTGRSREQASSKGSA